MVGGTAIFIVVLVIFRYTWPFIAIGLIYYIVRSMRASMVNDREKKERIARFKESTSHIYFCKVDNRLKYRDWYLKQKGKDASEVPEGDECMSGAPVPPYKFTMPPPSNNKLHDTDATNDDIILLEEKSCKTYIPPVPFKWYKHGVYPDDYDYMEHGLLRLSIVGYGDYFVTIQKPEKQGYEEMTTVEG